MMDWQEERAAFWMEFDLYDKKHEPVSKQAHVTYRVGLSPVALRSLKTSAYQPFILYVDVDNYDMVSLGDTTHWFGTRYAELSSDEIQEIHEYLVEWELAEWKQIGPEDSELFATKKLTESTMDERFV
jgi:hypothetical protein